MASAITRQQVPLVYEQIKAQILRELGTRWRVGQKLPPIPDLAQELGAGQRNTYRAVRALVAEGYLIARRRLGTFVTPLILERDSEEADHADEVIGWIDPISTDRVASESAVRVVLLEATYHLDGMIRQMELGIRQELSQDSVEVVNRTISFGELDMSLHKHLGDVLVLLNPDRTSTITADDDQQICILTTGYDVPVALGSGYDVVTIDEEQGGFLAGRRMREIGCESVAFIGRSSNDEQTQFDSISTRRLVGFERGWGKPIPPEHLIDKRGYVDCCGAQAVADFVKLSPRPEGVFTASDELAVGFVLGALAVELEPCRDYLLIGFDGQEIGQRCSRGPLTTVLVPAYEMGRTAGRLILKRLREPTRAPKRVSLGCDLLNGTTATSESKGDLRWLT